MMYVLDRSSFHSSSSWVYETVFPMLLHIPSLSPNVCCLVLYSPSLFAFHDLCGVKSAVITCIFGEVFVYFFGVITLGCIWLALSMHFRRGICILFGVITLGCIWLALSMHFRRGICILFWCDYVVLYMVGTHNAFLARYLYTFLV